MRIRPRPSHISGGDDEVGARPFIRAHWPIDAGGDDVEGAILETWEVHGGTQKNKGIMGIPGDPQGLEVQSLPKPINTEKEYACQRGRKKNSSDHVGFLDLFSHPLQGLRILQVTDGRRLNPIVGLDVYEVYSTTHLCKAPTIVSAAGDFPQKMWTPHDFP